MRPAPLKWPNNAKIVVSFFVAFEAFDKSSQYRRHEGDKPDYASLAYGEYGGKAGIWRILDALNSHNVKGTIDTNGRVAEIFPALSRSCMQPVMRSSVTAGSTTL